MNILVIKPSSLGDIIHGLQVMQALRAAKPDVSITWVVRDLFAPLVEACNTVDQVIVFRRKGGLGAFYTLLKKIRMEAFDWVFDLQGLARSGIMTASARAKNKAGRSDAREWASLSYHYKVPLPERGKDAHAVEILLQFLPLLDVPPQLEGKLTFELEHPSFNFPWPAAAKKPILLFPSSRREEKDWPRFAELTACLLAELKEQPIVWVGHAPFDGEVDGDPDYFFNLTGKTTLLEMVSLMQTCQMIVSNDSGPMHLGAAMDIPLVAIFGPTSPQRFGPYPLDKPSHCVLQARAEDFSGLSVDEVLPAVKKFV